MNLLKTNAIQSIFTAFDLSHIAYQVVRKTLKLFL